MENVDIKKDRINMFLEYTTNDEIFAYRGRGEDVFSAEEMDWE